MPDICKQLNLTVDNCEILIDYLKDYCPVEPKKTIGKSKTKRKPSTYNVFMGECVKARPKDQVVQNAFKACAAKYREEKAKGKKVIQFLKG